MMVFATAIMVSLLGITSLEHLRINRSKSELVQDRMKANVFAQSAVGLGLRALEEDPDWRSNISSGEVSDPLTVMNDLNSQVYWVVDDSDGDFTDEDTLLSIRGVGSHRDALQVAYVEFIASEKTIGPTLLRNEESDSSHSDHHLEDDDWWGQYLVPNLPAEATAWKITSVEILMAQNKKDCAFTANIYGADNDQLPNQTIYDSVTLDSSDFSHHWGYQAITFSGDYWLNPGEPICFTLESDVNNSIKLSSRDEDVFVANSALLESDGNTWQATEDESLHYRVNGVYKNGEFLTEIVEGSWRRGDLP